MDIPQKPLRTLLQTLEDGGVSEFEYEDEKFKIRIKMGAGAVVAAAGPASVALVAPSDGRGSAPPAAAPAEDLDVVWVTSPFVGTFYRASGPGNEPFTDVGKTVRKGQTLCIVEAMKLMNEIEAEVPGTVLEIALENGRAVEFGQKLFKIKKA